MVAERVCEPIPLKEPIATAKYLCDSEPRMAEAEDEDQLWNARGRENPEKGADRASGRSGEPTLPVSANLGNTR